MEEVSQVSEMSSAQATASDVVVDGVRRNKKRIADECNKPKRRRKPIAAGALSHSKRNQPTAPGSPRPSGKARHEKGRWLREEHEAFLQGLSVFGRNWEAIKTLVPTRSAVQIRTHCQKYEQKLARGEPFPEQPYESRDSGRLIPSVASIVDDTIGSFAGSPAPLRGPSRCSIDDDCNTGTTAPAAPLEHSSLQTTASSLSDPGELADGGGCDTGSGSSDAARAQSSTYGEMFGGVTGPPTSTSQENLVPDPTSQRRRLGREFHQCGVSASGTASSGLLHLVQTDSDPLLSGANDGLARLSPFKLTLAAGTAPTRHYHLDCDQEATMSWARDNSSGYAITSVARCLDHHQERRDSTCNKRSSHAEKGGAIGRTAVPPVDQAERRGCSDPSAPPNTFVSSHGPLEEPQGTKSYYHGSELNQCPRAQMMGTNPCSEWTTNTCTEWSALRHELTPVNTRAPVQSSPPLPSEDGQRLWGECLRETITPPEGSLGCVSFNDDYDGSEDDMIRRFLLEDHLGVL